MTVLVRLYIICIYFHWGWLIAIWWKMYENYCSFNNKFLIVGDRKHSKFLITMTRFLGIPIQFLYLHAVCYACQ